MTKYNNRRKKTWYKKWFNFKEARRQNRIQKKHNTSQKRSKKKTQSFLGQICYKSRTWDI